MSHRPSPGLRRGWRRRARAASALSIAALMLGAGRGMASGPALPAWTTPPWVDAGDLPLPARARSARILKADQPILDGPAGDAQRRGSAERNVDLPVFAARRGGGCKRRWLEVGPAAWVCEDAVALSTAGPIAAAAKTWRETPDGLPFRYYFVGPDGSFGYRRITSADVGEPDTQLEPGFAVAIVEERLEGGSRYGRTHRDLWVPMRDLGPARGFAFSGAEITAADVGDAALRFAWVAVEKARLHTRTGRSFAVSSESRARFERVPILEEIQTFSGSFVRIAEASARKPAVWLAARDVRHPSIAPPPDEVNADAGERWIDVDLSTQTLVAYEGHRPVFATLTSTGKGRKGSATATPPGTYRVWIKLLTSDMDNLEDENASRYYRIEDVPYVQYFSKGVGLHGAFWHRSFGRARSHGCVNLAPLDAQRLFWWTAPRLPAGWTAVAPTAYEPGTVIRVR